MKQIALPPDYAGESTLSITGKDHHYLSRVLRIKTGAELLGRDREGNLYLLTVTEHQREKLVLGVGVKKSVDAPLNRITLYQCLPKGRKMDQIIRQVTELGVNTIVPVNSERTNALFPDKKKSTAEATGGSV